jgi:hypothetical protein
MWPAQESVKKVTKKHITSNRDREGMNEKRRTICEEKRRAQKKRIENTIQEGFQGQVKER